VLFPRAQYVRFQIRSGCNWWVGWGGWLLHDPANSQVR
jgi:hypothetical protein